MAQAKNLPNLPVKKFALALCSKNVWGVITSDQPKEITFGDGSTSTCHTGFACRGTVIAGWGEKEGTTVIKQEGDLWASRNPHVVAYLGDFDGADLSDPLVLAEILAYGRHKLSCMNL
jgi:hypothetical protein